MSCLLRARIISIHAKIGKTMAEKKKAAITAANQNQCKGTDFQRDAQGYKPQKMCDILDNLMDTKELPFAVMKVLRKHKKGGSYGK